jgi:tRNA1(Val) A37 N6-methylase TrmN6
MSNRNMNAAMSDFMKRNYNKSKGDLYSAFIERCAELLGPDGRLAMIAQQSFMFISSFEGLRDLRWTPLSRPFFARNKLMSGGVFWVSFWGGE